MQRLSLIILGAVSLVCLIVILVHIYPHSGPSIGPNTEAVLALDTHLVIESDGGLRVREVLDIRALGEIFKFGIRRVIRFADDAERQNLSVQVISATLDGGPIPYSVEEEKEAKVIYIRRQNTELAHGDHTFEVTYLVRGKVKSDGDSIRLLWEAVGAYSKAPHGEVSVTVVPPNGITAESLEVAGILGNSSRKVSTTLLPDGAIRLGSKRTLNAGEGFLVTVGPKR